MNPSLDQVKSKVREFQIKTNFGRFDEDCFAPWWLKQKFLLSEEDATMLCSDGNFDFGLDGFYLQELQDKVRLSLVQTKFSENINEIKKGINDITRFIPTLFKVINGLESDNFQENILIRRLRAKIKNFKISETNPLEIDAYVVSLSNSSVEFIENKSAKNRADLVSCFEEKIKDNNVSFSLRIINRENLIENNTTDNIRSSKPTEIYFNGSDEIDMNESIMLSGIGKLSDLVELYELRGNQLFDKNVRLFLYGKKNQSTGPAGKIRETLKEINNGNFLAEKFAFLHNGITLYTKNIIPAKNQNKISITNPSILNGCQTIKSSFFFYQDYKIKNKLNDELWKKIPITLRIISTNHNDLWREVAESNNRQNSMKASALRANDEIQIDLENDFKDLGIFYQRQESAFENISRSNSELIEKFYFNSLRIPITIESLAQTIICGSDIPLSYATRQNDVFESQNLYSKVFSKRRLKNLKLLIFIHNVRGIIDLALDKAIPANTYKYENFKVKSFRDLFTRLVMKSILKKNNIKIIDNFGEETVGRRGTLAGNLVEEIRKIIRSNSVPILQVIGNNYWNEKSGSWHKQDDHELLNHVTNKLKLSQIEVL